MKAITPFLWFDDKAEQAAKFYVSVFKDGQILSVTPGPGGGRGKKAPAMSVTFRLRGQDFMALNGGPSYQFSPAISFFVSCKTQKEIDHFWRRLSQGGEPGRCGWLKDKYGLSWQIVPDRLGKLLPKGSAMHAMLAMKKLDIAALEKAAKS